MKLKSLILTIGLSLLALSGLLAQDKYEYATVVSRGPSPDAKFLLVHVSYSTGEFKKIELENPAGKSYSYYNQTLTLKLLSDMSAEGWEVINYVNDGNNTNWSYFLKRKSK